MKFLLYGLNYSPEPTGIGKYSGEMAEWLVTHGHEMRAVVAPPYYPAWKITEGYRNRYSVEDVNGVKVYRCPLYVPSNPNTKKRLFHLYSFVYSSFPALIRNLSYKPDVVVNVIPTLFTTLFAWMYARCTGAKLVCHIQDFEGDAMFGLGMARKGFIPKLWGLVETFLLQRADYVSTISNAMIDNAVSKGVDRTKTILFPNWSELERFQNVTGVEVFKEKTGLSQGKKIILYSGNVGRKQGLELMLKAAWLKRADPELLFVIVGEGSAKAQLIEMSEQMRLENILFLPLQPYELLPQLLASADVHLVIQNPGVADAVLPSKLTNILAVGGNAVITTFDETEMGRLAIDHPGSVFVCEPECEKSLLKRIETALLSPKPNQRASAYAKNYLDKSAVLAQFVTDVS